MDNYLELIANAKNVTSYYFFNDFLEQLPNREELELNKFQININLQNVDFINAEVLPYFLSLGDYLKRVTGNIPKLYIPWKPDLLSYLHDINFLRIIRNHDLFDLFEETIGGYTFDVINPNSKIYYFKLHENKTNISNTILNSLDILHEIYKDDPFNGEDNTRKLNKLISELCHNGCNHSEAACALLLEYNKSRKSIQISISDCGIGYANSFEKKGYKFKNVDKRIHDIEAILNALYHRADEEIFGIHSVIKYVVNKSVIKKDEWLNRENEVFGEVKVHTNNTQIILSKSGFGKFIYRKECFFDFLLRDQEQKEEKYKRVKQYNCEFPGVHIEMKIPV